MIRYFPSPYPDESIYSLFVRYSKHIGKNNIFSSVKELLGKMHLRVSPLFVGNLAHMCSILPEESDLTVEYLINNHTALPFYKPFIPKDRYNRIEYELKYGTLNAVYTGLGITAGSILQSNKIKYCPQCINEDREQYREAYLHRMHQLQGVFTCAKHNSLLKLANSKKDSREVLLDLEEYNYGNDISTLSSLNNELLTLTSDVEFFLNNFESFGDLDTVNIKYKCCMHEKGYISPSGLMYQVKLHSEFKEFYSEEFLSQLQSQVDEDDESNWLRAITRKKVKVVHPIRHLIFIRFLFGNLQNFIEYPIKEYMPFGNPPFPCLNQESEHYGKLLINECKIKTNNHTSESIGIFLCPQCKYLYTLNEDKFRIYGFEKVSKKNSLSSEDTMSRKDNEKINYHIELEEKYKNEITEVLSKNPNVSRSELINMSNKAYRWLYKHKKEWLVSRVESPKKHKDFYKNTRISWNLRDPETLEKVKVAIENIYKEPIPIRITIKQVSEACNYGALNHDLNKLPLTNTFLINNVESLEQFHKRKIEAVVSRMIKEERKMVKHLILREAGIPDKYYHNYDNFIKEILR
jgi:hypothetical protein